MQMGHFPGQFWVVVVVVVIVVVVVVIVVVVVVEVVFTCKSYCLIPMRVFMGTAMSLSVENVQSISSLDIIT